MQKTSLPATLITSGLLVVTLAGCIAPVPRVDIDPPQFAPGETYDPTIAVRYYPRGSSLVRDLARPIPDYRSWPRERMRRDLRRFTEAGVDVVLINVEIDRLEDWGLDAYEVFLSLAATTGRQSPKLAFVMEARDYQEDDVLRFLNWAVNTGVVRSPVWWRAGVNPIIVLGEGLKRCYERHPAFTFRRAHSGSRQWDFTIRSYRDMRLSPDGTQATVAGGMATRTNGTRWTISRRNGRTIRYQMWAAVALRPEVIVVNSWNDFRRGSFVEPNSLDQERALSDLKREIARIRSYKGVTSQQ